MPATPCRIPIAILARRPGRRRPPGRSRPRSLNPLALWRTTEPERISAREISRLARRIDAAQILNERRWGSARKGDAAAAVGVAIDHLHRRTVMTPLTDIILGNLLLLALEGDPTAQVTVMHALRVFGRLDPSNIDLTRLALHWSRRPIADRSRRHRHRH